MYYNSRLDIVPCLVHSGSILEARFLQAKSLKHLYEKNTIDVLSFLRP